MGNGTHHTPAANASPNNLAACVDSAVRASSVHAFAWQYGWAMVRAIRSGRARSAITAVTKATSAHAGSTDRGSHRILWMASAALLAPAVLFAEWRQGYSVDPRPGADTTPVVAAAAAVLFVLVLARVNGLVLAQRGARAQEQALHEAGAALFDAATIEDTTVTGEQAIRTLMPPGQAIPPDDRA